VTGRSRPWADGRRPSSRAGTGWRISNSTSRAQYGDTSIAICRATTRIRYDARGNGLSDSEVEEVSFQTFVGDLETVVDAAGLERFDLLGISQGCAVSIG
jgi:pimeloyl-ACP methyl ester carboxylesterase